MSVEVIVSDEVTGRLPVDSARLQDYAVHVVTSSGAGDANINVVFVGDVRMTELNETYKKRTGSTDVLSFNLSNEDSSCIEGEVYISLERAEKQAADLQVSFSDEIIRLVTHGLLHLTGRAHDTPGSLKAMNHETDKMIEDFWKG